MSWKEIANRIWFALHAMGVPARILDRIDLQHEIDPTLTFHENLEIIIRNHPELEKYIKRAKEEKMELEYEKLKEKRKGKLPLALLVAFYYAYDQESPEYLYSVFERYKVDAEDIKDLMLDLGMITYKDLEEISMYRTIPTDEGLYILYYEEPFIFLPYDQIPPEILPILETIENELRTLEEIKGGEWITYSPEALTVGRRIYDLLKNMGYLEKAKEMIAEKAKELKDTGESLEIYMDNANYALAVISAFILKAVIESGQGKKLWKELKRGLKPVMPYIVSTVSNYPDIYLEVLGLSGMRRIADITGGMLGMALERILTELKREEERRMLEEERKRRIAEVLYGLSAGAPFDYAYMISSKGYVFKIFLSNRLIKELIDDRRYSSLMSSLRKITGGVVYEVPQGIVLLASWKGEVNVEKVNQVVRNALEHLLGNILRLIIDMKDVSLAEYISNHPEKFEILLKERLPNIMYYGELTREDLEKLAPMLSGPIKEIIERELGRLKKPEESKILRIYNRLATYAVERLKEMGSPTPFSDVEKVRGDLHDLAVAVAEGVMTFEEAKKAVDAIITPSKPRPKPHEQKPKEEGPFMLMPKPEEEAPEEITPKERVESFVISKIAETLGEAKALEYLLKHWDTVVRTGALRRPLTRKDIEKIARWIAKIYNKVYEHTRSLLDYLLSYNAGGDIIWSTVLEFGTLSDVWSNIVREVFKRYRKVIYKVAPNITESKFEEDLERKILQAPETIEKYLERKV